MMTQPNDLHLLVAQSYVRSYWHVLMIGPDDLHDLKSPMTTHKPRIQQMLEHRITACAIQGSIQLHEMASLLNRHQRNLTNTFN